MKIALVHMRHANTGGTELFLNNLSRYLAAKGEDVTIICRTHVEPSHPNIKFVVLSPFGIGKAHRMWAFSRAVEKHVASEDYDFVYALGKTWSHDMLRIGGGTHYHFLKATQKKGNRLKDRIALKIESRAMAKGAYKHIVANSHKSAREIHEAYSVPQDKISVIHNFVDTHRFDSSRYPSEVATLKDKLGLDFAKPTFLFLGTGYERKGLRFAISALAKLDLDYNFIVAGRESNQKEFEDFARQQGIFDKCLFLGERKDPEHLFSLADCYVLPTRYEPFGFTAIEAMACGTPVITTEQCGAKEVLNDKVSSILAKPEDPEAFAAELKRWAIAKGDTVIREQCRETAMLLDVDYIMDLNYKKILEIAKLK